MRDEAKVCYPVVGSDVVYVVYFEGVVKRDAVDSKGYCIECPVDWDVDAASLMGCFGVAVAVFEVGAKRFSFDVVYFAVD